MADGHMKEFVEACRDRRGAEVTSALRDATAMFLADAAEDPALLGEVASMLDRFRPAAAAWVALTLGTSVERGSDPDLTGPALLSYFQSLLPLLPTTVEDSSNSSPDTSPEQVAMLEVFPQLCQAVVAHLARMPERREILARDQVQLDRLQELEDFGWGAAWVREAILKTSGTLVALHPQSGRGVRLKYANVSNCFHLFSLLQTAVGRRIPGGRRVSPVVASAARGKNDEPIHDQAWWHYGDPRSPEPKVSASIWGEALVRTIPVVDDVQMVLLWPPLLASRGWDSGFFGPQIEALPSDATIERALSRQESNTLLERLGINGLRKWWRLW